MSREFKVIKSPEDLGSVANEILQVPAVGLDLETIGYSPFEGDIRLMALNTGKNVYVVDLFHTRTLGPLEKALPATKAVIVGQNLKFDIKWLLHKFGIELYPIFDTFRASNLVHNGVFRKHDLYSIYERELNVVPTAPDMGGSDWSGSLTDEQYSYSAEDVTYLLELRHVLKAKLAERGLNKTAILEFAAITPEASMELNGFYLDKSKWLELYDKNLVERERLTKELMHELPHPTGQIGLPGVGASWKLSSPKQKLQVLQHMGLPVTDTTEMTLAMHAAKYPVIRKLISYNKVNKRCTSFGPEFLKFVNSSTGRVHTSFFPFTGAGRYASSKPNMQQIPREKSYRECFSAEEGNYFVIADYSQIELRAAAQISGDKVLIDVYRKGLDAHTKTAALVNSIELGEVTKSMRQAAKPVNFGLIFGMGPDKLILYAQSAYGVSLSEQEAKRFRDKFFEGYSGIKKWHKKAAERAEKEGVVRTLSGRLRHLGENIEGMDSVSSSVVYNTPIQGTAADGLKCSLPIVYKRLKSYGGRAKLVHMVHDEIAVEIASQDMEEVQWVKKDLEEGMIEGMQPWITVVPVEVEASIGNNWADKK